MLRRSVFFKGYTLRMRSHKINKFRRRVYPSIATFWKEFKGLIADRKKIREVMRSDEIAPCFRERLMLAVTSVNKCRYCAYGHSLRALEEGISKEEIQELYAGTFDQCPEEELPALLYAQHWAESGGEVDQEAREVLVSNYGKQKAEAIEMTLRLIQMGNLLGNTFDYFIYRVTLGRKGLLEEERQAHIPVDGVTP
jgi:AhpD family alkylhydroperoxidase